MRKLIKTRLFSRLYLKSGRRYLGMLNSIKEMKNGIRSFIIFFELIFVLYMDLIYPNNKGPRAKGMIEPKGSTKNKSLGL